MDVGTCEQEKKREKKAKKAEKKAAKVRGSFPSVTSVCTVL